MGAEKDIIVAIEFGSSAIRGIAGVNEGGNWDILAIEQEKITGIVRHGVIYNIDKTKSAIERIKERLSEKLGLTVTRAYVGIAGQSVRTVGNRVKRVMDSRILVTLELVEELKAENLNAQYADCDILEVIPQEYNLGINNEVDPVGTQTDQIEGCYLNVIARTQLKENILNCMHEAGLEVAGLLTTPLAEANALLQDSEKRSGCALIDLGAETTTLAIYTKNILRHLVTIPLGSNHITKDIVTLKKVGLDEAEALKTKYGVAMIEKDCVDEGKTINLSNNRKMGELELKQIVSARMEEIIANIWHQIEKGKWQEELLSGIILTGGGAAIKNIIEAIAQPRHFDINRIKMATDLILSNTPDNAPEDIEGLNAVIALMMRGSETCVSKVSEPEEEEQQKGDAPIQGEHPAEKTLEEEAPETGNVEVDTNEDKREKKKGPSVGSRIKEFFTVLVTSDE